jgi:hypothetical protein
MFIVQWVAANHFLGYLAQDELSLDNTWKERRQQTIFSFIRPGRTAFDLHPLSLLHSLLRAYAIYMIQLNNCRLAPFLSLERRNLPHNIERDRLTGTTCA